MEVDNLCIERNTISHILHIIAEHIINQDNWILGDSLTNIIANIDNNQQRHLITIDNVFAVSLLILIFDTVENVIRLFYSNLCVLQELGIDNLKNISMLKEYFLLYASCVHCSKKYVDYKESNEANDDCVMHFHAFTNFAIQPYMIPIIVQQFLTDINRNGVNATTRNDTSVPATAKALDVNEIEHFWRAYERAVPNDLEIIWESIENGLHRYLEVHKSF